MAKVRRLFRYKRSPLSRFCVPVGQLDRDEPVGYDLFQFTAVQVLCFQNAVANDEDGYRVVDYTICRLRRFTPRHESRSDAAKRG